MSIAGNPHIEGWTASAHDGDVGFLLGGPWAVIATRDNCASNTALSIFGDLGNLTRYRVRATGNITTR